MVSVYNGLHRIANVVDAPPDGLRVGVAITDGVGIINPEEAALGDHQVRVAVKLQEWRKFAEAVADGTVVEDAAAGRQIIGKQQLQIGKPRRK